MLTPAGVEISSGAGNSNEERTSQSSSRRFRLQSGAPGPGGGQSAALTTVPERRTPSAGKPSRRCAVHSARFGFPCTVTLLLLPAIASLASFPARLSRRLSARLSVADHFRTSNAPFRELSRWARPALARGGPEHGLSRADA